MKKIIPFLVVPFLNMPLSHTLQASAEGYDESSGEESAEPRKPVNPERAKQLQKMSAIGKAKDLSHVRSLGGEYCPAILDRASINALLNAPTEQKQITATQGHVMTYYNKVMINIGARRFSANIKNADASAFFIDLQKANRDVSKPLLATLSKQEEDRAQDTGKVVRGASLCTYRVYTFDRPDRYDGMIQVLQDGIYADFSALAAAAKNHGAVDFEGGKLFIASSQPGR